MRVALTSALVTALKVEEVDQNKGRHTIQFVIKPLYRVKTIYFSVERLRRYNLVKKLIGQIGV